MDSLTFGARPARDRAPRPFVLPSMPADPPYEATAPDSLAAELVARVRATIGPVATLKTVVIVPRLPKTRSGKVLRRAMRDLASGVDVRVPATIEAPGALGEIAAALERAAAGR